MRIGDWVARGALSLALLSAAPRVLLAMDPREAKASSDPAPGERGIAGRLLAPCCYTQTLDVHDSPLTHELRLEVRQRLLAGESAEAVEQRLVDRYGERIRATSKRDPLPFVAAGVLAAAAMVGLLVLRRVRRWRVAPPALPLAPSSVDAYDARLDAELAELD